MILNITLGGSVHGTLIGLNNVTGFTPMVARNTQSVQFPANLINQWTEIDFYFTGVTTTGSTISFTSNGVSWSQQVTQNNGLIRRFASYTISGLTRQTLPETDILIKFNPITNPTHNTSIILEEVTTRNGADDLKQYTCTEIPGTFTETESGTSGIVTVSFYNPQFDPNGTVNVSIT